MKLKIFLNSDDNQDEMKLTEHYKMYAEVFGLDVPLISHLVRARSDTGKSKVRDIQEKEKDYKVYEKTGEPDKVTPISSAVRTRDQDDPHDDAHPEGERENSASKADRSYQTYEAICIWRVIVWTVNGRWKQIKELFFAKLCDHLLWDSRKEIQDERLKDYKSDYNDVKYGYVQKELHNMMKLSFLKLFEEEIEAIELSKFKYEDGRCT
ncbi:hypothetical protein Tco_1182826 [Tanacetum coccineum]